MEENKKNNKKRKTTKKEKEDMKKWLLVSVTLIATMTFAFAAGGSESTAASTEANLNANNVAIILQQGGLGDQGYNDGAKVGFDMMVEKYGIDGVLVEAAAVAEADTFIRQLASEGYGLIICLDWTIIDFVKAAAPDYPNTKFVVLGKSLPGPGTLENLIEPYTALHERAFLCAMASILFATDGNEVIASKAKPGCTVAVMAAGQSINNARTDSAYQQAIQEFNPDAVYISDTSGHKTNTALNQTIAENLIRNQNVEVIWANIGTGSLSVYSACALNDAYAIGVDINQDGLQPGTMITSGLHNTTYMVVEMIEAWQEGTLNGLDEYYWGLKTGVVGITDMSTIEQYVENHENFDRIKATIDEYVEKIENGDFIVYNYFTENRVMFDDWQAAHPGVDYTEWVKAGRPE